MLVLSPSSGLLPSTTYIHTCMYVMYYVCVIVTIVVLLQNHLKRLQTTFMNFLAETNGMLCSPTLFVSSEFHISCCTVFRDNPRSGLQGAGFDL